MRAILFELFGKLTIIAVGFFAFVYAGDVGQSVQDKYGEQISLGFERAGEYLPTVAIESVSDANLVRARSALTDVPEIKAPEVVQIKPPVVPAECTKQGVGRDTVVLGDNLRLRIFESAAGGGAAPMEAGTAAKIAYERLDLSGVYEVGQDGAISVPLVGRIDVVGRGLGCIEPIVEHAAFEFLPGGIEVNASYVSRPSVIAQGDLSAPGRYEYVPGMTVEHLLTLAGATKPGVTKVASPNAPYLSARKSELERAVMGNLVKWYRVSAALEGKKSLRLNDAQLVAARDVLGSQRIDAEMLALSADIEARQGAMAQLAMETEKVALLLDQKRKHVDLVLWQVESMVNRYSLLLEQQRRGVVPMSRVAEVEVTKMQLERMLLEAQSDIIELQAREMEVASAVELQRLRDRQALAIELRNISEEADGLQGQLLAVNQQLGNEVDVDTVNTSYVSVTIDRVGPEETTRIKATPSTLILPGDVVTMAVKVRSTTEELASRADLGAQRPRARQ